MKHTPLRDVLTVSKALSDAQRVRILMLLRDGELCVCQIVAVLDLQFHRVETSVNPRDGGPGRGPEGWPLGVLPARGRRAGL